MKTLRRKFIIFAMSAVTVLLMLLVLSINGINFYLNVRQENMIMETLVKAEGNFKIMDFSGKPPAKIPFYPRPDMDQMHSERFFAVKLDKTGKVIGINLDQIFSVSPKQAEEYAVSIYNTGKDKGRIDRFHYFVKRTDDKTEIFFLDNSRFSTNLKVIFSISVLIAVVSWLIVLVFVILISGRVVQPIIAGYEKQKRFITDAGHELKTPLAIIQTNNDAMTLIHGENKYNRNIKSQVVRLSKLTADLLMLAKHDETIVLQKEIINIDELLQEILPAYRDAADSRGLTFTYNIQPEISFRTNRESLTKLITILLDNAIKYTSENGDIALDITGTGNHLCIIETNSCELPENKNTDQLFERFYRGDSARTQKSSDSGYGLGLSIARMITENLGGTLKAEYTNENTIRFTAVL